MLAQADFRPTCKEGPDANPLCKNKLTQAFSPAAFHSQASPGKSHRKTHQNDKPRGVVSSVNSIPNQTEFAKAAVAIRPTLTMRLKLIIRASGVARGHGDWRGFSDGWMVWQETEASAPRSYLVGFKQPGKFFFFFYHTSCLASNLYNIFRTSIYPTNLSFLLLLFSFYILPHHQNLVHPLASSPSPPSLAPLSSSSLSRTCFA